MGKLAKRFISIGCLGLTLFIIYKNIKPEIIFTFNKGYFVLGFIFMLLYSLLEAVVIKHILRYIKINKSILSCYKYAIIGFFFSGITPFSTGGQPMQIYYMEKEGNVPVSHSSFTLILLIFCYRIVIGLFGILGYIFKYDYLLNIFNNNQIWFLIAIIINIINTAFWGILLFSPNITNKLINIFIKISYKIHNKLGKFAEENLLKIFDNYKDCSKFLNKNLNIIFKMLSIIIIQHILTFGIPFIVYKGLGLNGFPVFSMIILQALLILSSGYIPTPGSIAVSEGLFLLIFKGYFPEDIIGNAMIISRTISLYLPLFIYGILCSVWINNLPDKEKSKLLNL